MVRFSKTKVFWELEKEHNIFFNSIDNSNKDIIAKIAMARLIKIRGNRDFV